MVILSTDSGTPSAPFLGNASGQEAAFAVAFSLPAQITKQHTSNDTQANRLFQHMGSRRHSPFMQQAPPYMSLSKALRLSKR
jgi:hypothetical protein